MNDIIIIIFFILFFFLKLKAAWQENDVWDHTILAETLGDFTYPPAFYAPLAALTRVRLDGVGVRVDGRVLTTDLCHKMQYLMVEAVDEDGQQHQA